VAVVRLVADTHALVWWLTAPKEVGPGARRAFEAADAGRWLCCVPAITLVEIALLRERRRIRAGPADVLQAIGGRTGYAVLAAARATGARLVSVDESLDGYGVQRVWD
jgi:PIN domain nuclease of toxin-antitoxin system